jgi:hypothetical protein
MFYKFINRIDLALKKLRRSQWPSGLRSGFATYRLLGLRFRIPSGAWMSVSYKYCFQVEVSVATGRSLIQRNSDCGVSLCVIQTPQE